MANSKKVLKLVKVEEEKAQAFDKTCEEFLSRKSIYDLAKVEKDTFSEQLKHEYVVISESCKIQGMNYMATFSMSQDKYTETLDIKGVEITPEIENALNLLRASGILKTKVTRGILSLKDVKQV